MKILLAPLYWTGHLCPDCRRIFRERSPKEWLPGLWEFERLPPLGAFDPSTGFRPDYPNLLLFDEFVVDSEADQTFRSPGSRDWLGAWPELMDALRSEGALAVVDVKNLRAPDDRRSEKMTKRDLRNPKKWANAMLYHDAVAFNAMKLLGHDPVEAKRMSWEFDPENFNPGVHGSDGKYHMPSSVLLAGPHSRYGPHRELYQQAKQDLAQQLENVNACIAACTANKFAPFMWAPYARYMREKLNPAEAKQALGQLEASRSFFEIAFPAYSPITVKDFSRLRRDKRFRQLREEIVRATESGDSLDPCYPQRVIQEVLRIENRVREFRRISGWITTLIGSIPVPGLSIGATAVNEAVGSFVERKKRAAYRWFYLLSDGRGAT